MSKILVISDSHNKIEKAQSIIDKEDFDTCIFLGDFFDSYDDTPNDALKTAYWIRSKMEDKRFIFLYGNHDVAYNARAEITHWFGWTPAKSVAVASVLKKEHWEKFKFFWFKDGWFFSHAGINPCYLPPIWKESDVNTQNVKTFLIQESKRCLEAIACDNGYHWFLQFGDERCHPPTGKKGGLLWQGGNEELVPIKGLSQIVGHTYQQPFPSIVSGDILVNRVKTDECLRTTYCPNTGVNIVLDCQLKFYAVIADGQLQIKQT